MNLPTSVTRMRSAFLWLGVALGWAWAGTGFAQTELGERASARLVVALAQPGEDQTTGLQDGLSLWKKKSFPGSGFGEWVVPPGARSWTLRNPERADFTIRGNLNAGKCYALVVDSRPNPDPKTVSQFPRATVAELVEIDIPPLGAKAPTYGLTLEENIAMQVNRRQVSLAKAKPILLGSGAVMVEAGEKPIVSSDPQDPCAILLVFFKNPDGSIQVVRCRFF
jgi:hypothetical protein